MPVQKQSLDKDGNPEIRLTVDFTQLNNSTDKDRISMPTWDHFMSSLAGSKIYSKLDMSSAFHQIPLDDESCKKTAFTAGKVKLEYVSLPQGMSSSPASLIRLLNMVFCGLDDTVLMYLDDVVIHTNTLEQHYEVLEEVFKRLAEAKLQLSLSKCQFFMNSCSFLGFIITPEGLIADPKKIEPLTK